MTDAQNLSRLRFLFGALAFVWFVSLIIIERMGPGFIRFYVGDFMVVGFLFWCVLIAKPSVNGFSAGLCILGIAVGVEVLQLFTLSGLRNMLGEKASSLILGNRFDWGDLLAYVAGTVFSVGIHHLILERTKESDPAL